MNDNQMLDLARWYQQSVEEIERDYSRRREDIALDYYRFAERAFGSVVEEIDVNALISEYVEIVRASPFWNPLN